MDWVNDAEINDMIVQSRAETDTGARNAIYQEIYSKLVEDQRSVWLLAQKKRLVAHRCLEGYEWVPMQSWDFDFSRFRWTCKD